MVGPTPELDSFVVFPIVLLSTRIADAGKMTELELSDVKRCASPSSDTPSLTHQLL